MNCKPLPYFLLLHIFFVAASLSAADIKVDTVADEYCEETDETCSLREAIEAANTNAAVCGCPAGEAEPVFDNIPLPAGIYELSRGSGAADTNAYNDLDIASSLNILGPDTGYAVVSGRGLMRVFEIHSGTVMFSQLAIQYGLASPENGGGILVRGGIFTGRRITLTSNNARNGGGLYVAGETLRVNLENCTFYENAAYDSGGGIYVNSGTVRVENCTIASNSSDADGDRNGLGAGIFRDGGSISLHNTILAENYFTGGEEPDGLECRGDVGSDGFNVVGMKDGCNFFSRAFAGPDQRGIRGNRLHPLGENVLAYNGGPTWTVALPADSIAIDRGNPASFPVIDQRGFSRPSPPDVGAYEVVCGDGFVTGNEVCDDGNKSDTDGCLNTCVLASCGDGFVRDGVEACDDGNAIDTDACRDHCALPTCGNAVVEGGETCDDGNDSNTDDCLNTCLSASCGDGFVRANAENCDGEGCLDDCSGLIVATGGGAGPGDGSGGGDDGGGGDGGGSGGGEAPSGGGGCSLIIPKSN